MQKKTQQVASHENVQIYESTLTSEAWVLLGFLFFCSCAPERGDTSILKIHLQPIVAQFEGDASVLKYPQDVHTWEAQIYSPEDNTRTV